MEVIGCIFCDYDSSVEKDLDPIVIRENGWNGRQCQSCGLIYISPRPCLNEVLDIYENDTAQTDAATLDTEELYSRLCAQYSLGLLAQYAKGGDLLEIGAGTGFFLNEASHAGFSAYGIELNRAQAGKIEARGFACDTRPLFQAFPGRQFDVIHHRNVMSHFHDPIAEFRSMAARLRPGGVLIFETGNFGDVSPRWRRYLPSFQYPDHLFFLSAANIPVLLVRCGFSLLALYRYSRAIEFLLTRRQEEGPLQQSSAALNQREPLKHRIKAIIRYILTYRIGGIYPARSAPQTLITIAKKA